MNKDELMKLASSDSYWVSRGAKRDLAALEYAELIETLKGLQKAMSEMHGSDSTVRKAVTTALQTIQFPDGDWNKRAKEDELAWKKEGIYEL